MANDRSLKQVPAPTTTPDRRFLPVPVPPLAPNCAPTGTIGIHMNLVKRTADADIQGDAVTTVVDGTVRVAKVVGWAWFGRAVAQALPDILRALRGPPK